MLRKSLLVILLVVFTAHTMERKKDDWIKLSVLRKSLKDSLEAYKEKVRREFVRHAYEKDLLSERLITCDYYANNVRPSPINVVQWIDNGRSIAVGIKEKSLEIVDIEQGLSYEVSYMGHDIRSIDASPRGNVVATVPRDSVNVLLCNREKKTVEKNLFGHVHGATVVRWSPDNTYILTGDNNGQVRLWDVVTGKKIREWGENNGDSVSAISWGPESNYFVAGFDGGSCFVWDRRDNATYAKTCGEPGSCTSIAYSENHQLAFSGSGSGNICIQDLRRVNNDIVYPLFSTHAVSLSWLCDGRYLAAGSETGDFALLDRHSLKKVHVMSGLQNDGPLMVASDRASKQVAIGSSYGTVRLWSFDLLIDILNLDQKERDFLNSFKDEPTKKKKAMVLAVNPKYRPMVRLIQEFGYLHPDVE